MKKAIEEYFPIVEVNRLAVPERNSFKPIYTMHKWFARRSSSVFRAILLGALKPAGTDIMKEFYKDHTNDPDTKGVSILDPFMGGGTTVVEALRLGCKVTGIDLNPVAWFIVKTEVEPVDIGELENAFDRLSKSTVGWSGKSLKETLLEMYKTECPCCGNTDADTIYSFWVKSAPCTTALCTHETPLFSDYVIAQKNPSINYYEDCKCTNCNRKFDLEIDSATMIGDPKLMINASQYSAGIGRANARWTYSINSNKVTCPWCTESVSPILPKKKKRKKVPLNILYCPNCEEVWQYRGELTPEDEVICPTCRKKYNPNDGNIPSKGKFVCRGTCGGNVDNIINSIRSLPSDKLLDVRPYAIEGYCEKCAGKENGESKSKKFFELDEEEDFEVASTDSLNSASILKKNNGKFFKRFSAADLSRYKGIKEMWEREKENLPYPKSKVPIGEKTKSGLIAHHYVYWYQMFNERQLLALSSFLRAIIDEPEQLCKEIILSILITLLENNNLFARYNRGRHEAEGVFARHDFQPKVTITEGNIWGSEYGKNNVKRVYDKIIEGKEFCYQTYDRKAYKVSENETTIEQFDSHEQIKPKAEDLNLNSKSSTELTSIVSNKIDYVITDPPYAGNVNYSELADFFYVWLRLVLKDIYPHFQPEQTPKVEEVIENKTRGKSSEDFKEGLKNVFSECFKVSKDDSLLVFTFHHAEDSAWEALLDAVCGAGYYIESVYPINGEAENSLHLMNNEAIAYDLIHVCKKRNEAESVNTRAWAGIRNEIRRKAREELTLIEAGRYGNERLPAPDVNILLIGKCLELYSKYYGRIVDFEDKPVPIHKALEEIKMMVDQLITKDNPLPPELEDIDVPSYIYFTSLCRNKEIQSDSVSKSVRGIIDISELKEAGILIKGRENRGRTYQIKQPVERLNDLKHKFLGSGSTEQNSLFGGREQISNPDIPIVDIVHLLLGLAETGENVQPWIEKFSGKKPQIRAAMEYLKSVNRNFAESADRVLAQLDVTTLFTKQN